MNTKRAFYSMIGVVCLLFCLIVTAAVLGDLWIQKQSKQLLAIKLDNRLLEEQQVAVTQAKKDIQKYAELDKIAKTIVPQDKDQAKTVREIVNIAASNGVPLTSISFPASTLGSATAPAASSSDSSSSSSSKTKATTTPSITQVTPVSGMSGVYQMLVTIQSSNNNPVPYASFIKFLKGLENNRHTAQVSTMIITPHAQDISKLSFTLGINVYIRP